MTEKSKFTYLAERNNKMGFFPKDAISLPILSILA